MQDKFALLGAELEEELVERTEEIRCALLALVAGCTFFMLGPPGVAKSLLARRIAARLSDVAFFDAALNKHSTPETLFGPFDLTALRAGRWERVIDGTLATAQFAHVDEIFEANTALLGSMLWALNERIYRHGTTVVPMQLSTVFMSSNSVPTEPRIGALWDRLVLRRVLSPVAQYDGFTRMLLLSEPEPVEAILSWGDVQNAQVEAAKVEVPIAVADVAWELRRELAKKSISPSDRRFREAMKVVRAVAWLDRRTEATPADLWCLRDIMWLFPDQAATVRQVTDRVLAQHIDPSVRLLHDVRDIRGQIRDGLNDADRVALAEELGGKIRAARVELETLERRGRTFGTERVRTLLQQTSEDVAERLFVVNVEERVVPAHRRGRR